MKQLSDNSKNADLKKKKRNECALDGSVCLGLRKVYLRSTEMVKHILMADSYFSSNTHILFLAK